MEWDTRQVRRSARDVWLFGVCGGLGEHTPWPAWLWRALFVATTLMTGVGLVAYVALWLFMPRGRFVPPAREERHAGGR